MRLTVNQSVGTANYACTYPYNTNFFTRSHKIVSIAIENRYYLNGFFDYKIFHNNFSYE